MLTMAAETSHLFPLIQSKYMISNIKFLPFLDSHYNKNKIKINIRIIIKSKFIWLKKQLIKQKYMIC